MARRSPSCRSSRRALLLALTLAVTVSGCVRRSGVSARSAVADIAPVRRELERLYIANADAFKRGDIAALMELRAPDFHTVTPDGTARDRAAMQHYMQGIINGVKQWNKIEFAIDSLHVAGDTAYAIVSQHLDRMALRPDNQVHHVETWVTQREVWIRSEGRWRLWRVDGLRNQRRLIDGQPG